MADQPRTQDNARSPQTRRLRGWWLVVALLLLTWNVMLLLPRSAPQLNVPYSRFLAQVKADNVSSVRITGDSITGTFVKPLEEPRKAGSQPARYAAFRTTFPAEVGDPGLVALLGTHRVTIETAPASPPWFLGLIASWLPMLLLVGFLIWMTAGTARGMSGPLARFGRLSARRYASDQPGVTFADVAGADEAKADLQEQVDFLRNPKKYHDLGARLPRGVLLVGPPGTGKTLLARAVAGEAGVPFFSLNASEFVEMFVGVGASRVRDLFRQAKEAAPAIVFIDELDAVGRRRGAGLGAVNDEREQTLNQLLGELDGFEQNTNVVILSATNRPDVLDPALLRPGRFDRQVVIELPDRRGREAILAIHAAKLRRAPDVDISVLARTAIGLSGADLANLCNEAALTAARHNRDAVTMADFEEAQDKLRLGTARRQLSDPDERRAVAFHESGHALVAWLTPTADPVRKVTIVPHGRAIGLTEQFPGEDRHYLSRSYLEARLAVLLAGRIAEEIAIGEVTTGAENDLVEATSLARRMAMRWGMGELGLVAFKDSDEQPFLGYEIAQGREYSEATAARVDRDVQRLLEEAHETARLVLTSARLQLNRLVETLLETETVGADELARILGPRREKKGDTDGVSIVRG
ncbi:ATP-dependent metallopeptidase FtsH/Yme1/Tma family protein [bacterium]|nr:MAG: ATP-dependent metallopeptidase FtsH/Yme1/Tma family protein [bacterium]